ncbi:MAG: type II secretion system F family protein [Paracoccaceae bacterium]
METLAMLLDGSGLDAGALPLLGIGAGAMLVVFGLAGAFARRDPVLNRLARSGAAGADRGSSDAGILKTYDGTPSGLMKSLVPTDEKARSAIRRDLEMAGFVGPNAVTGFFLIRFCLGILLPALFAGAVFAIRAGVVTVPESIDLAVAGIGRLQIVQGLCLMVGIGFFGPALWLRSRVAERRQQIAEAFPNALDLIQISVEAGLGFDAAMIRVGNELQRTAPALSQLLLDAQRAIQAGRPRDRALLEMAARTGLDEVAAFANVVLQSIQYGTSISGTLSSYAREMRVAREVRAQERSNRLPVQMSAIMAALMLPALVLLTLGPVIIRYMRYFGG